MVSRLAMRPRFSRLAKSKVVNNAQNEAKAPKQVEVFRLRTVTKKKRD